ncbi:hypothetical protein ACP4OV_008468 [Aristida adscensionis]
MEVSTGGVQILCRRLVRPAPASSPDDAAASAPEPEPEVIHLTPWDLNLITVDYIQKGVLLPKPTAAGAGVVDDLASSFARALARFYPFAGRLAAAEVGDAAVADPPSFTISLLCTGEGAEFVHAAAPGVTVADITSPAYIPSSLVWSMFPMNGLLGADAAVERRPVLAAQVTELADGVFVAASLNHGVADGSAFWHFFNTWSEINRRSGGGGDLSTPAPARDRWFLADCLVPIPLPFGKVADIIRRPEYPPVRECFLTFSAARSRRGLTPRWPARRRRRRPAWPSRHCSPFLRTCGARRAAPEGFRRTGRRRTTSSSDAGRASGTAWLLNRAVASFDEAKVRGDLASWARQPRFKYVPPAAGGDAVRLMTGSSPRFDVYGNDFGWGRPVAVRSGAGNKVHGKATVFEGRGGGGSMALEVCLPPEDLARLVADEEFMDAVTAVKV